VASAEVAATFRHAAEPPSSDHPARPYEGLDWPAYRGLVERQGNLLLVNPDVATLLKVEWRGLLAPFWEMVLGVAPLEPVYRIVTPETAFYYHLGPAPVTWQLRFPYEGAGYRYNEDGVPAERVHGPFSTLTLARREYALIWRSGLGLWCRV